MLLFRVFLTVNLIGSLLLAGCSYAVINAASAGHTAQVVELLSLDGYTANDSVHVIGIRPLTLAAGYGHLDAVKVLLDHGADINAEDVTGWTALHAAAHNGHVAVVKYLLDRGALQKGPLDAYRPSRLLDPPERDGVLKLLNIAERK